MMFSGVSKLILLYWYILHVLFVLYILGDFTINNIKLENDNDNNNNNNNNNNNAMDEEKPKENNNNGDDEFADEITVKKEFWTCF